MLRSLTLLLTILTAPMQTKGQAILLQLDAQTLPSVDGVTNVQDYASKEADYWAVRKDLVRRLYWADPENDRLPDLFVSAWAHSDGKTIDSQIEAILSQKPTLSLEEIARYTRAKRRLGAMSAAKDWELADVWKDMGDHCLYSSYTPKIMFDCAQRMSNRANRVRQFRIISQLYPGFERIREVQNDLKDWSGNPDFELDFKDVCTNKPASVCAVRGKVLLVYFATAGMAPETVTKLYARYHAQGMEAIGVVSASAPVSTPWPLLADKAGAVIRSWGVETFPTVFLVDKQGRLAKANPADLEGSLRELLAKPA